MKFSSTRGQAPSLTFSQAVLQSLAPDGGLYVPEIFPQFDSKDFSADMPWKEVGKKLLKPFLEGDPLQSKLEAICDRAFTFDIPVKYLENEKDRAVLELFHGPTAAFKDVGARFLAECVSQIGENARIHRTVLVATSGDTGGAVASAFFGSPWLDVVILFPKGKISPRQEKQLTAWGGNIRALSVKADFDACQRVVKEAFSNKELKTRAQLLSANSINLGRILPQTVYYAYASLKHERKTGEKPSFFIPTGNLGNAVAAFWAKKMGFPIGSVFLATNANHSIPDFFHSGSWSPKPTLATLANAMDVGNPSNMERLLSLYPDFPKLASDSGSFSVDDVLISKTIAEGPEKWGEIWCPHTATAVAFFEERGRPGNSMIVSTAHPSKFDTIVEPLIGKSVEVPPRLQAILSQTSRCTEIEPTLDALIPQIPIEA